MKRILFALFVFASILTNGQNWKSHPKKPYSSTDSCLVFQDSTKRFYRVKCSEIGAVGSSIDTTKVGRIEQGRGTAPIFMYFNGTAWIRNDTSYVAQTGTNKFSGDFLSNQSFFTFGLNSTNNHIIYSDQNYGRMISENSSSGIQSSVGAFSSSAGSIQLAVTNPTPAYSRQFVINGSSSATPNLAYMFDKGIAYYNGDYSAEMEASQNTIPSLKKVKQLISDSVGTVQSTALEDGKIWIGDGTNTAFPRALSGDATVSNTGVVSVSNATNAGTATALQTARTIGIATGDVTSSGSSFDGTTNNTNALTIANLAVSNAKIANATIDLTTKVTGVLPLANGGTGTTYGVEADIKMGINNNAFGLNPVISLANYALRDPSDIIKIGSTYYVYFTAVSNAMSDYPNGYQGSIYVASSSNLRSWTVVGEVVAKGGGSTWDAKGCYSPAAYYDGTTIWICYGGTPSTYPANPIFAETMGMASSTSPTSGFTKSGSNPIITSTSGQWDDYRLDDPSIVYTGSEYRIYYVGSQTALTKKIGYSYSSSLSGTWTKYAGNPILLPSVISGCTGLEGGNIFKHLGKYHVFMDLFYSGSASGKLGKFVSHDGIAWTQDPYDGYLTDSYTDVNSTSNVLAPGMYVEDGVVKNMLYHANETGEMKLAISAVSSIMDNIHTGIAGGNVITGGTNSGNTLTLSSTSNSTKGSVVFGTSTVTSNRTLYDEVNNRIGIGTITPLAPLDVITNTSGGIRVSNSTTTGGGYIQSGSTNNISLLGGYYYDGTNNIARETTGSSINCNLGLINFNYFSGATIGSPVTPSTAMRITNGGLVGIGTISPSYQLHLTADMIIGDKYALHDDYYQSLSLHNQTTGEGSSLRLITKDNNGAYNQTVAFEVIGVPGSANRENANIGYFAATQDFQFFSNQSGSGVARPLRFGIGINPSEIYITTSRNVGISTSNPTSTLNVNGSFALAYVAKTGTYTATANDYLVDCTSGTFTVTLPTAVGITGRVYEIVNSGAGTITVATTSSQTFVNVTATPTTLSLITALAKSVRVMSNGANWIQLN